MLFHLTCVSDTATSTVIRHFSFFFYRLQDFMINLLVESLLQGSNLEELLKQSLQEEEHHISDQKEKV